MRGKEEIDGPDLHSGEILEIHGRHGKRQIELRQTQLHGPLHCHRDCASVQPAGDVQKVRPHRKREEFPSIGVFLEEWCGVERLYVERVEYGR